MCFSNLPVEFDEEGNPSLADEAEDVDQPNETTQETDADLAVDPEDAYETIVASLPDETRQRLGDACDDSTRSADPETAESD